MQKQLRKPANWQDFEQLCKRLWGEIWQVPYEIKLHGRPGQAQHGVDIYAVPSGHTRYWGIQCKLKDESAGTPLGKGELAAELAKAQTFSPALAGFIVATTANKDAALEQAARELDLASRQASGPSVLLYCWDDIVSLLDQHPSVLHYYLTAHQLSGRFGFAVGFADGQAQTTLGPEFTRRIRVCEYPAWEGHPQGRPFRTIVVQGQSIHLVPTPPYLRRTLDGYERFQKIARIAQQPLHSLNRAACPVELRLTNSGAQVLENWKVVLEFQGPLKSLSASRNTDFLALARSTPWQVEENRATYRGQGPLVQGDAQRVTLYVLPLPEAYVVPVRWQLLARDYTCNGELQLLIKPRFFNQVEYEAVGSPEQVRESEILSVRERVDE